MATVKQERAFQKTLENGGNVSRAMREVGYKKSMSKNPQKLTRTKGWEELLDQHLADDKLIRVHSEGLRATKKQFRNNNDTGEIEMVAEEPDYAVRHKYLETAYKIKGRQDGDGEQTNNFFFLDSEQINAIIARRARSISSGGEVQPDRFLDNHRQELPAELASRADSTRTREDREGGAEAGDSRSSSEAWQESAGDD